MSDEKRVVIVGASHAGTQAAFALRKCGWTDRITLIGEESVMPYHRPPLSKTILTGEKTIEQIALRPQSAFAEAAIELRLGQPIVAIYPDRREVEFGSGERLAWDKLLLATGAAPRSLPVAGADLQGVHSLRDLRDINAIQATLATTSNAVVIGGGYIGLEVAATLRKRGVQVTVLEAADRLLARVTEPTMSAFFTRAHRDAGVDVRLNAQVTRLTGAKHVEGVELAGGEQIAAELVIVGIGVVPETALARSADVEIENGVKTDEFAQTSVADIFAIGDCANTWHPRYGAHLRVESVQNAGDLALIAAHTICGQQKAYAALPWFWSDQYDIKLQIAGLTREFDSVVERGSASESDTFSLCYLRGSELLAVEAVNQPRDFAFARQLLAKGVHIDAKQLADPLVAIKDCVIEDD